MSDAAKELEWVKWQMLIADAIMWKEKREREREKKAAEFARSEAAGRRLRGTQKPRREIRFEHAR